MCLKTTCDFCQGLSNDLRFDEPHVAIAAIGGFMYGFFCKPCSKMNDTFWEMEGIKIRIELEIVNNKRAFRRMRNEFVSVQDQE